MLQRITLTKFSYTLLLWVAICITSNLNAQCGNLQVQVVTTNASTYYNEDGSLTIQLSGDTGTFQVIIETGGYCEIDEYFCDLFGGEYCDQVLCTENFTVHLTDSMGSVTFSDIYSGDYPYSVSNNNGCLYQDTAHVGPPCEMTMDASYTHVSAPGADDGTITVSTDNALGNVWIKLYTAGGFGGTDELLDSVENGGTFSGLAFDLYIVQAIDSVLCPKSEVIEITGSFCDIEIHADEAINPSLFGLNDGSITMNGSSSYGDVQVAMDEFFEDRDYYDVPQTYANLQVAGAYEQGVYYFAAIDTAGCEAFDTITLVDPPCALMIDIQTHDASGGANGSVDFAISNGVPYYAIFLYDNDDVELDDVETFDSTTFFNLLPGDYHAFIYQISGEGFLTDYNCETEVFFSIGGTGYNCDNLTSSIIVTDVTTYGGSDGMIEVSASGGYGDVTIVFNGDCEGEIFGLVGDAVFENVREVDDPVHPYVPDGPDAPKTLPEVSEHDKYGSLLRTGDPSDTLINSGTFMNLAPGDYHICFSDSVGCELVEYISVGSALCEIVSEITTVQPSQNTSDGSISVEASITGTDEDARIFIIRDNYGVINDGFNTVSAFNLPEDTYYINVFGAEGEFCYYSDTVVLDDGLNCDIDIEVSGFTHVTEYGAADGTISVESSSSFGNVTLSLAGQQLTNSGTFTGLGPGNYNVQAVDEVGCPAQSGVYFITQPQCDLALGISVDLPTSIDSANGAISITTSGVSDPVYITVAIPSIFGFIVFASGVNALDVTGLSSFYYIVTAYTDDYVYCSEGASLYLPVGPCVLNGFATAIDASGPYSSDGQIIAGANGGTGYYTITGPGEPLYGNTFTGLAPGEYTINFSDVTGCTATATATVSSPGCFELGVFLEHVTEYGGSDGSVYGYFTEGVSTGNVTYTLNKDGQFFASQMNNASFPGLEAGEYELSGADEVSCNSSISFTISQPECVLDVNTEITPVSIHGGADGVIEASASGGLGALTFSLLSQMTQLGTAGNPATFDSLMAGGYALIVADEAGCDDTLMLVVTEPACAVIAMTTVENVSLHGDDDGSIAVQASGGIAPYIFNLLQGSIVVAADIDSNGVVFNNVPAGDYTVVIIDQVDCLASDLVTITEPDCAIVPSANATPVSVHGLNNGSVSASATGGLEQYSFDLILNGNIVTSQSGTEGGLVIFNNLGAGTYTVTVTDQGNCNTSTSVMVTEPACAVEVQASATDATMQGGADGSINASASGGVAPYTFELLEEGTTIQTLQDNSGVVFNGLSAGTYTVIATDAVGCNDMTSVTVGEPSCTETTWYADTDADGYGDASSSTLSCDQPSGYVNNSDDCDDTNPLINPDAVEECDGVDNNCTGGIDEGFDTDGDGTADCNDGCPDDPDKIEAGICGCGVADTDTDGDSTADCNDGCPDDPDKIEAGICGCGVADTDTDGDGTTDCNDGCPNDPDKIEAGICGCGVADTDTDGDGTADCNDGCPDDPDKIESGICGCDMADTDTDGDGTADCNDDCPDDPDKIEAGVCGCGVADTDADGDSTADCNDGCPADPDKIAPGNCGCGNPEPGATCDDGNPNTVNDIVTAECTCMGEEVSCEDGIRNGQELGIDCGGPYCEPCTAPEAVCGTMIVHVNPNNPVYNGPGNQDVWWISALDLDGGSFSYSTSPSLNVQRYLSNITFDWTTNGACIDAVKNTVINNPDKGIAWRNCLPVIPGDFNKYKLYKLRILDEFGQDDCSGLVKVIPDLNNSFRAPSVHIIEADIDVQGIAMDEDQIEATPLTEFIVAPNPGVDVMEVSWAVEQETEVFIRVADISGRLVLDQKLKSSPGQNKFLVEMSGYPDGVYAVQLQTDKGMQSKWWMKMSNE